MWVCKPCWKCVIWEFVCKIIMWHLHVLFWEKTFSECPVFSDFASDSLSSCPCHCLKVTVPTGITIRQWSLEADHTKKAPTVDVPNLTLVRKPVDYIIVSILWVSSLVWDEILTLYFLVGLSEGNNFKGYRLPTSCNKHAGTGSSSPKRARCSGVAGSSSFPLQARFHYLS